MNSSGCWMPDICFCNQYPPICFFFPTFQLLCSIGNMRERERTFIIQWYNNTLGLSVAIIHCLQFVYHAQSGQGCLCVAAIFHHFRVNNETVHLVLFNIFCIAGIADVWSLPPLAKFTLYLSPLLKSLLFWFSGNNPLLVLVKNIQNTNLIHFLGGCHYHC